MCIFLFILWEVHFSFVMKGCILHCLNGRCLVYKIRTILSVCLTHEDLTSFAQGNENFGRRVQLSDFKVPDQMWMFYSCTTDNSFTFCVPIDYKHGIFIQMWSFALCSGNSIWNSCSSVCFLKLTGIWVKFQPINLSTANFFKEKIKI